MNLQKFYKILIVKEKPSYIYHITIWNNRVRIIEQDQNLFKNSKNTIGKGRHSIDFIKIKQSFIIRKYFIGTLYNLIKINEIINRQNLK